MTTRSPIRLVSPTPLTWIAFSATLATLAFSLSFLIAACPSLPALLPVHFGPLDRDLQRVVGGANGWQYKTYTRVLMPVLVQAALALILGAVSILVLSRSHREGESDLADIVVASTAAEAVALISLIWVAFQAYAAVALVMMWHSGRPRLGGPYIPIMAAGIVLSIIVGLRAQRRIGRPTARAFVAAHWRFGHLYLNRSDPALFVPTRTGSRWTLNFGRPVTVVTLALVLGVGIVAPTVIMGLLLR